eukprot:superscaffoldBa00004306_g18632
MFLQKDMEAPSDLERRTVPDGKQSQGGPARSFLDHLQAVPPPLPHLQTGLAVMGLIGLDATEGQQPKEVLLEQERRAIRSLRCKEGNPGESHL